jgi:tetratricopeptide (TPR) repeat protein
MPPARPVPTAPRSVPAGWSSPWIRSAGIVVAVVAAYWNSLQSPFLFDDRGAVQENASIRQWSTALQPPADGSTTTGRPVVNLSFALNHALGGNAVWGYHALNLLIHAATALLLFGVMRRTLRAPVCPGSFSAAAEAAAFFTALLWAVHPLQTESVTCIAQRTESLCGLFYLLTLYAFARGAENQPCSGALRAPEKNGTAVIDRRYSNPWKWYVLSVLAVLLGLGTKEVAATVPLLVLLYDRTFLAGSFAAAWRQRRGYYVALATSWLVLAGMMLARGGARGTSAGFGLGISSWEYLLKQCEALVLYLKLSVWPHPLVLDYGTGVIHSPTEVWWQGLVVLTLLAGTAWALVRRPVLGFAGAWFFIILAPSSSVVPLVTQTMAEHRMYLPLAAVIALGVFGVYRGLGPRAGLALGVAAAGFTGLTIARNHDYREPLAIWSDTVAKCPQSARAQLNLGVELQHQGREAEAIARFERAVGVRPDYVAAHYSWGATLLAQGRVYEAIERLETALMFGPGHADAQLALGNALVQAGRAAEALSHFETSLELKPAADAHYNLAVVLAGLDRGAEAEKHLRQALRLDPGLLPARRRLGMVLAQSGRLEEAAGEFSMIVAALPADADAHANLGNVRLMQGRAREAIAGYETALRLRPGDARTEENLRLARESLRP